jgi:hypothetical protein
MRAHREIPKRQRSASAKPLQYSASHYLDRDRAIAAAYGNGPDSMRAIADNFGVGGMTVSWAVKRGEHAAVRADGTWETPSG